MTRPPRLRMTQHARQQMVEKGFDYRAVIAAYAKPDAFYESRSHPGQMRLTGRGLCLVGRVEGDTFAVITVYLDRVLTPPRPDQMGTTEGARYAERYALGMGRG